MTKLKTKKEAHPRRQAAIEAIREVAPAVDRYMRACEMRNAAEMVWKHLAEEAQAKKAEFENLRTSAMALAKVASVTIDEAWAAPR